MTVALTNELTPQHTSRDSVKGWNVKNEVNAQYYVPTPPSPVPRAASKFLFNAHPAKHAAIKYKDEVDDQKRRGQASSNPESHCCNKCPYNTNWWKKCAADIWGRQMNFDAVARIRVLLRAFLPVQHSQLVTPPSSRAAMSLLISTWRNPGNRGDISA